MMLTKKNNFFSTIITSVFGNFHIFHYITLNATAVLYYTNLDETLKSEKECEKDILQYITQRHILLTEGVYHETNFTSSV